MRSLEIRRHSFTKKGEARGRGSHLSRDGVLAARSLGASLGRFDHVFASTAPRTMETAVAMGFAVDDLMEMPSPVKTGEVTFHSWREWSDPFTTLQAKAGASAAIDDYLKEQAAQIIDAVERVADGGSVLVVAHGGWIESVVAGLVAPAVAAQLGGSFWHLDGIRLVLDTSSSASVELIDRFPR